MYINKCPCGSIHHKTSFPINFGSANFYCCSPDCLASCAALAESLFYEPNYEKEISKRNWEKEGIVIQ